MDISKDLTKRLDDLTRGIDQITEKVDVLASNAERQFNTFKTQLADFKAASSDVKDNCEKVRADVGRLARDLNNLPLTAPRYGQQQAQMVQPPTQMLGGINPEQLAWAISQAVSQSVATVIKQVFTGGAAPGVTPYGANAGIAPQQHQA